MKKFILVLKVAIMPLVVTAILIVLWKISHKKILTLFLIADGNGAGQELSSDLIVLMPNLFYSVIAGFVINYVMQKHYKIKSALTTIDARAFLAERDQRLLPLVHGIMIIAWLAVTTFSFVFPYSSEPIGTLTVGTFGFLGSFGFAVTRELDNPFSGIWKIDLSCIHKGWMTMTMKDILRGLVPDASRPETVLLEGTV